VAVDVTMSVFTYIYMIIFCFFTYLYTQVKLGKRLRKNNLAVDVISFGESPVFNTEILQVAMCL